MGAARKNGVFSIWRRDCLIAGVPLKSAARWVALGNLARSFAKSFRLVAFKGVFLFLDAFLAARSASIGFSIFFVFAKLTSWRGFRRSAARYFAEKNGKARKETCVAARFPLY